MIPSRSRPADLANRSAERLRIQKREAGVREGRRLDGNGWRRHTFMLPREAAREMAREMFERYPKSAYLTEIEFWRECEDGQIEFTMRRLPTAD